MNFLKGFLVGTVFSGLLIYFLPYILGESVTYTTYILQDCIIASLAFGGLWGIVYHIFCMITTINKEIKKNEELMHDFLDKKTKNETKAENTPHSEDTFQEK